MTKESEIIVLPPTVKAAGDPREKDATWLLLPVDTRNGECSQCGRLHEPSEPHDQQSLAYQYAFYAEHDCWPTWTDAMAHCDVITRQMWTQALAERGIEV